jgi:probable rRNA maturation factor
MNIVLANRQRTKKINARLLKQIVGGLFAELKITEAELGINLVGAREMTLVNETFLQHEGSTDVITFDHSQVVGDDVRRLKNEKPKTNNESPHVVSYKQIHGELFVCVDEAVLQARQFGTSWQAEVVRYVVHGVLHLLGHDDLRPAARRTMKREENRLVRGLAKRFSLAQLSGAAKLGA